MKLIYSKSEQVANRATSVTASSENLNYPASNLILGQMSKVWRSVAANPAIASATLTVVVPAGVNDAIGIFGTNATAMTVAVKDVTEATTYATETFDLTPASPARTWNRVWKEWTNNNAALHIVITLTAPVTVTYHECGEIVVGTTVTIPDPKYGLTQTRENFQVVQELAGGGFYIHSGLKPRAFDMSFVMLRETEFDDLDEIYDTMGQNPIAMLLSDGLNNDMKWCGYFHIVSPPKANHDMPTRSIIPLSIREAI